MPHGVCKSTGVLKIGGYVGIPPDDLTGRPDMTRGQRQRIRRYYRGVCLNCNSAPVPGKVRCQRHIDQVRENSRRWYERDKARHLEQYGMSRHRLEWLRARRPEVQARLVIG